MSKAKLFAVHRVKISDCVTTPFVISTTLTARIEEFVLEHVGVVDERNETK